MGLSLYQVTIPTYLQMLGAVSGLIDKAEAHCREINQPAETLIGARLADDMMPFAFQVSSLCHHAIGAIRGVRDGVFSPDTSSPPVDFAGLRSKVSDTIAAVEALDEEDVNQLQGKAMRFEFGDYRIEFVGENFLLSFSQPNFYFHVTTAYDILRAKGLSIGKMDYMGQLRTS